MKNRKDKLGNLQLTNDLVFKAVFGRDQEESKKALIPLLNQLLEMEEDPIKDIIYKNPFSLEGNIASKESVMDIKVETSKGTLIDVEMQVDVRGHTYVNRSVFYAGKLLSQQLDRGDTYRSLRRTVVLSILVEPLFRHHNRLLSTFWIKEKDTNEVLTELLEIRFFELSKIDDSKPIKEMSLMEQSGLWLKSAGTEGKENVLKELGKIRNEVIEMANPILEKVSADSLMREAALAREMWKLDQQSMLEDAIEEGEARGRAEGEARGRAEGEASGKLKVAKNMLEENLDINTISKVTGLSKEDISALKKS